MGGDYMRALLIAYMFILWITGLYIFFKAYIKEHRCPTRYEMITADILMAPYNIVMICLIFIMFS